MKEHTDDWTPPSEAIDRAFAGAAHPEKFTDHPYCEECADAHEYFSAFTPETLAKVTDPPETLAHLVPHRRGVRVPAAGHAALDHAHGDAVLRPATCSSTSRTACHALSEEQRCAVRDFLYLVYDRLAERIHETAFDYPMLWRILNDLGGSTRLPEP